MDTYHKKVAVEEFKRRSDAYAICSSLMDQSDLDMVVGMLNLNGDKRVLDVATGTGHLAMSLSPRVKRVIGIDITRNMLNLADQAARRAGFENITYLESDAEYLPFKDAEFDAVTCRFSFHHFPAPAGFISEMVRILRPDGRLIIEDMVSSEDQAKSDYQNAMENLRDPSHIRHYRESEIVWLLEEAGLEIVDWICGSSDFDIDHWIGMADPFPGNVERIREMMRASMEGDLSGLNVRVVEGGMVFTYATAIVAAMKEKVFFSERGHVNPP